MSSSPIIRRLSSSTSMSGDPKEDLINAYEAEEERIINVLSRKLEQLREEKISLENVLEAESESHVNRLNRELSLLRARQRGAEEAEGAVQQQQQQQQQQNSALASGLDPRFPTPEAMMDAMRKENEALRNKLVDMERDYVRIARLNEVYREELIDHRRRLGLSVDSLVGLAGSATDPYSQPLHRRSGSSSSSPSTSVFPLPGSSYAPRSPLPLSGVPVPIPRPPSQLHRPMASQPLTGTADDASAILTPLTTSPSPSSSVSPFPFSPVTHTHAHAHAHRDTHTHVHTHAHAHTHAHTASTSSYLSTACTQLTTPSSAGASLHSTPPPPFPAQAPLALSYPSVPPPSLSSSLGSPTFSMGVELGGGGERERRGSRPCARIAEVGNLRDLSRSRSRRGSGSVSGSVSGSPVNVSGVPSPVGGGGGDYGLGLGFGMVRSSSSHRVAETGSLSRRRSLVNGEEV